MEIENNGYHDSPFPVLGLVPHEGAFIVVEDIIVDLVRLARETVQEHPPVTRMLQHLETENEGDGIYSGMSRTPDVRENKNW